MYGRITEEDEQAWKFNDDKNRFANYSDNDCRQVFFLAHHQMLVYHEWLSYCLEEAALFQNFEVNKPVCTASINEK